MVSRISPELPAGVPEGSPLPAWRAVNRCRAPCRGGKRGERNVVRNVMPTAMDSISTSVARAVASHVLYLDDLLERIATLCNAPNGTRQYPLYREDVSCGRLESALADIRRCRELVHEFDRRWNVGPHEREVTLSESPDRRVAIPRYRAGRDGPGAPRRIWTGDGRLARRLRSAGRGLQGGCGRHAKRPADACVTGRIDIVHARLPETEMAFLRNRRYLRLMMPTDSWCGKPWVHSPKRPAARI